MTGPHGSLLRDAEHVLPELVALRRDLHAEPELGLNLPRTRDAVLAAIDGLGLEITTGTRATSVTAVLRGGRPGPTVLLRGDMDALPLTERTTVDFSSRNGAMHACGHDLHTTGLVGAARLLAARRDTLAGSVILMFQPGEEGHDGARVMIDEGVLDAAGEPPAAAFAVHVGPGDRGVFVTRPGPILAGAAELRITIRGAGGHGSQPHSAVDPIPAAAELIGTLQAMITRRFPSFDPVVLSITRVRAGDALNVIPDLAEMAGTVRMVSRDSADRLPAMIRQVADGVAAAHGCTADVEFAMGYPVTVNDPAEAAAAAADLRELVGDEAVLGMDQAAMGSEDFSLVLEQVPGCYVFLGARPAHFPQGHPGQINHSPTVEFDDAVLGVQSAALAHLAIRALARHS